MTFIKITSGGGLLELNAQRPRLAGAAVRPRQGDHQSVRMLLTGSTANLRNIHCEVTELLRGFSPGGIDKAWECGRVGLEEPFHGGKLPIPALFRESAA